MPLAVNAVAVATPEALVATIVVMVPLANVPLALVSAGAVNVTFTGVVTALLFESFTVATSDANCVPSAALCCEPLVTAMEEAAPGVLVNRKLALVAPVTLAVTVY